MGSCYAAYLRSTGRAAGERRADSHHVTESRPWAFHSRGTSSPWTIPSIAWRTPRLIGCSEIRQASASHFSRGNECAWPTSLSSSLAESPPASFGLRSRFSRLMTKDALTRANSQRSNLPSPRLHWLPFLLFPTTKRRLSTHPIDLLRKEALGLHQGRLHGPSMTPHWGGEGARAWVRYPSDRDVEGIRDFRLFLAHWESS